MNKLLNILYGALGILIVLYGLANAPTLTWSIIVIFFVSGLIFCIWDALSKLIEKLK